jgi:hypothetical protein
LRALRILRWFPADDSTSGEKAEALLCDALTPPAGRRWEKFSTRQGDDVTAIDSPCESIARGIRLFLEVNPNAREELLCDGFDIPFVAVRKLLGENHNAWRQAHRIKLGGLARAKFFEEFHAAHGFCWLCGTQPGVDWETFKEAHHWTGPIRSDEISCVAMACRRCHRERVTQEWLPRWAWAVWNHNREHCDWLRATIVRGSFLETPEAPPNGEFWPVGFGGKKVRSA